MQKKPGSIPAAKTGKVIHHFPRDDKASRSYPSTASDFIYTPEPHPRISDTFHPNIGMNTAMASASPRFGRAVDSALSITLYCWSKVVRCPAPAQMKEVRL